MKNPAILHRIRGSRSERDRQIIKENIGRSDVGTAGKI